MHRVRRTRAIGLAGAIALVAFLGFAAAGTVPALAVVPWLLAFSLVFTVAQMIHAPASRALLASIAPPAAQGRAIATYELSWGMAAAASPATFGILFGIAPAIPWLAMVVAMVVAVLLLAFVEPGIAPDRYIPARCALGASAVPSS